MIIGVPGKRGGNGLEDGASNGHNYVACTVNSGAIATCTNQQIPNQGSSSCKTAATGKKVYIVESATSATTPSSCALAGIATTSWAAGVSVSTSMGGETGNPVAGETVSTGNLACKVTTRQCRTSQRRATGDGQWYPGQWTAAAVDGYGTVGALTSGNNNAPTGHSCAPCSVAGTGTQCGSTVCTTCKVEVRTTLEVVIAGDCPAANARTAGNSYMKTTMQIHGWSSNPVQANVANNFYTRWIQKKGTPNDRINNDPSDDNCKVERESCEAETNKCKVAWDAILKGRFEDPGDSQASPAVAASTIALRPSAANNNRGTQCYRRDSCTSNQAWQCWDIFVFPRCLEESMQALQNMTTTGLRTNATANADYNARAQALFAITTTTNSDGESVTVQNKLPPLLSCLGTVTNIRFFNQTIVVTDKIVETVEEQSGWKMKWWWFLIIIPCCVAMGWIEWMCAEQYYKEKFHMMDADGDGQVSAEERMAFLMAHPNMCFADIEKYDEEYLKADLDGDGIVSAAEQRNGSVVRSKDDMKQAGASYLVIENANERDIPSPPASPRKD